MENEFVRDNKIIEKTEIQKELELIKNIIKTREDLKNANKNFEFAETELIDFYSYEIKAFQSKLDYLIKLAKVKGIEVDVINEMKMQIWGNEEEAV